jgi:tetratricopeptide (TPR) repeat protein
MKALEKDRNRRYESASAFATDVERYLNDEPVHACPPSVGYRLRKFARRNKNVLVTAAVFIFAALLSVAAIGWAVRDRIAQDEDVARERASREQRLSNRVKLILDDVDSLMNQHKWHEAQAVVMRAQRLVADRDIDHLTLERMQQAATRLKLADRLERSRLLSSALFPFQSSSRSDGAAKDRAYTAAFAEYGVDVKNLPPAKAAALLHSQTTLGVAVAEALDDWRLHLRTTGKPSDRKARKTTFTRLLAVSMLVDSDPLRNRLRSLSAELEDTRNPPGRLSYREFQSWRAKQQTRREEISSELMRLADVRHLGAYPLATLRLLAATLATLWVSEKQVLVLRKAQQGHPTDFMINYELARALRNLRLHSDAIRFFSVAHGLRPGYGDVLQQLGDLLYLQKRLEEAAAYRQEAVELDPKSRIAYMRLGSVLRRQGKLNEAVACYRKAIELEPEYAVAHIHLGNALHGQKKLDEAIACYRKASSCYRKAIELDPKSTGDHNNLAWLLATCPDPRFRDPLAAVAAATRAVKLMPPDEILWNTLGVAQYRNGDWNAAVNALKKSMQLSEGGRSHDWFFLAMAEWQLGHHAAARTRYDKAVAWMDQRQPENEELRRFRAEAEQLMGIPVAAFKPRRLPRSDSKSITK